MPQLCPGDVVGPLDLVALSGEVVQVPDPRRLVHLQFRRFAGCPICDLHLRDIARRHGELKAAGVVEVALFHSSKKALAPYAGELPFAVVPDPGKQLYVRFGVEAGARALTNPGAWAPLIQAVIYAVGNALAGRPSPPRHAEGGRLGLPADLLISPEGRVIAAKYGEHAADHWSVDELLALAELSRRPSAPRIADR